MTSNADCMYKGALFLTYFFSLLLITACSSSGYDTHGGVEIDLIALDRHVESNIRLDSLTYIPLETTGESLLESISKIIFKNQKFYILDNQQGNNGLFVFSETGKFLRKVSGPGAGPGEYTKLMDFDVDSLGNLFLFDFYPRKLMKFDSVGHLISEINGLDPFMEFTLINDSTLFFNKMFIDGQIEYLAGKYALESKHVTSFMPGRKPQDDPMIMSYATFNMARSGEHIYFYRRFSDAIYQYNQDSVSVAFHLKNAALPPNKMVSDAIANVEVFLKDEAYLKDVSGFFENTTHVAMTFYKQRMPRHLVIDKQRGTQVFFKNYKEYLFTYHNLLGVADDRFIGIHVPYFDRVDEYKQDVENATIPDEAKQLLSSLDVNTNPVLVLFRFAI